MKRMDLVGWVMITAMAALMARAELPQLFAPGSIVLFQGDSITHGGRMGDMNHDLGHGCQAHAKMADFWIKTVAEEFACGRGTPRNGGAK